MYTDILIQKKNVLFYLEHKSRLRHYFFDFKPLLIILHYKLL